MDKDMLTEFKPVVNYSPSFDLGSEEFKDYDIPHAQQLCEAAGLASQPLPRVYYRPLILQGGLYNQIIREGKLSTPQIETVIHAMQRFLAEPLNGQRLGYFIGDQTGVGKSRMIAALFKELCALGYKKGVWVSASMDLCAAALVELQEVFHDVPLFTLKDIEKNEKSKSPDPNKFKEGIVFVAYSMLRNENRKRYKELKAWMGNDFRGMIAFDECHNAKGVPDPNYKYAYKIQKTPLKKSATRIVVEKLQKRYKEAAILYVSATAGHQPTHWSYMSRLGLWGKGCIFRNAGEFVEKMKHRKMQGMEVLTLELKKMGAFCCRQISLDGVQCKVEICPLTDENKLVYAECTRIWQVIYQVVCIEQKKIVSKRKAKMPLLPEEEGFLSHSMYWAENQRFFEALIVCFKTEGIKKLISEYPADGQDKRYSIVLSLQSTGGSMLDTVHNIIYNDDKRPYSFCRSKLRHVLTKINIHPVVDGRVLLQDVEAHFSTGDLDVDYLKNTIIKLFWKVEDMLPMNAIDGFIESFGGQHNVAEITGRRKRNVLINKDVYRTVRVHLTAEEERDKFQSGEKRSAIISQKGSTGINLHDSIGCTNDSTRVQICVQFPWQAESGLQQFGRTHRSHQRTNPIFILLVTDVPAEMRFYASFLERVKKLGAMCQGERRASPLNFDLDCEVSDAIEVASLACSDTLKDLYEINDSVMLSTLGSVGLHLETNIRIDLFLNRLLCVPIEVQSSIMATFRVHLSKRIVNAREKGSYDEGIKGFSPKWKLEFKNETVLGPEDQKTTSSLISLRADRGLSWDALSRSFASADVDPVFFTKKRDIIVGFAIKHHGSFLGIEDTEVQVYRTYSPLNNVQQRTFAEDLKPDKGWIIETDLQKVTQKWKKLYERAGKKGVCEHVAKRSGGCKDGKNCKEGMRVFNKTVIADNLLQTWDTIINVYESRHIQMQTVQVCCRRGNHQLKFVGILVPDEAIDDIKQAVLRYYAASKVSTEMDYSSDDSELSDSTEDTDEFGTESDDDWSSENDVIISTNWQVVNTGSPLTIRVKKSDLG